MEALEFLKKYKQMCNLYKHCEGCPLSGKQCLAHGILRKTDSECLAIVSAVEQWSKERPVMTNVQKLKEVFGDEAIYAVSSPNVQALKNWLDEPYKEQGNA